MFYRKQPDKHFMEAYFVYRRFPFFSVLGAFCLLPALPVNLSYSDWDSRIGHREEQTTEDSAENGLKYKKEAKIRGVASSWDESKDLSNLFVGCLKGPNRGYGGTGDNCQIVRATDAVCGGGSAENFLRRSDEYSRLRRNASAAANQGNMGSNVFMRNSANSTKRHLLNDICDCKNNIEQHYIDLKSEIGRLMSWRKSIRKKT